MDKMYDSFYYPFDVKYQHLIREIFYSTPGTKYLIQIKTPENKIKEIQITNGSKEDWDWDNIKFPYKVYHDFYFKIINDISYVNFGTHMKGQFLAEFESKIDSIKHTKGIIFD
jgi:hypothetical protein